MPTNKTTAGNAGRSIVSYLQVLFTGMDLHRMITELEAERARLDQAIEALERLNSNKGMPRRGRPPGWLKKQLEEMEADEPAEAESAKSAKA